MQISASVTPKQRVVATKFQNVERAFATALLRAVEEGTLALHAEAVKGVMKMSPGAWQIRYNPKRRVRASRPGDPPNIDTGVFVRSIQFQIDHKNMAGYVGTNDVRGPMFEFGTSKMAPRPWLLPAWKKAQKAIRQIFKELKVKIK